LIFTIATFSSEGLYGSVRVEGQEAMIKGMEQVLNNAETEGESALEVGHNALAAGGRLG
jgi:hypothetical protein